MSDTRPPERRGPRRHPLLVGLLLAAWLWPAAAHAEDRERARRLYQEGEAAYSAGRFLEAARRFEAAYAEAPLPRLLWNLGRAYRRQHEIDHDPAGLRRAREVLRAYVREARDPVEVQDGQRELDEVERLLGGAEPAGHRSPPRLYLVIGVSTAAAGLAVAGAGLALGLLARGEARTVESSSSVAAPAVFGPVADHQSRGEQLSAASYALYAVGGAAAVAGLVLALRPPSSGPRVGGLWLSPAAVGAGAALGGRF